MPRSASHRDLVRASRPTLRGLFFLRALRPVPGGHVGSLRSALTRKINVKIASGGPGSESGGEARLSCVAWMVRRGGCRRVGCSPRLAPEATRNLPGGQAATTKRDGESCARRSASRQNPGRATPVRQGEHPTLKEKTVRRARPGHRPLGSGAMQDPTSGTPFRFPISPATPTMGFLTSAAHLREHSIDQRSAGPTGSQITTEFGNLDDHRIVDQIGAAASTGAHLHMKDLAPSHTAPPMGLLTASQAAQAGPDREPDGKYPLKSPGPMARWENSQRTTRTDSSMR